MFSRKINFSYCTSKTFSVLKKKSLSSMILEIAQKSQLVNVLYIIIVLSTWLSLCRIPSSIPYTKTNENYVRKCCQNKVARLKRAFCFFLSHVIQIGESTECYRRFLFFFLRICMLCLY